MGDWRNQQPIHCKVPQEAWLGKVNEPTFSIIPVGVFMGGKLITCDKYTSAWTSCHFCQPACEQKHFSNAVILAMVLANKCPMQKLLSKHTKTHDQTLHPKIHRQNMTAYKKMQDSHKLWHWWHAVSLSKTLYTCCHYPSTLWGNSHVKWQTFFPLSSPVFVPGILTHCCRVGIFFFFTQCSKMLKNGNEIICSCLSHKHCHD